MEKGCGGFLFACCKHNVASQVKSGIGYSPTEPPDVPEYYGPVMNDPSNFFFKSLISLINWLIN